MNLSFYKTPVFLTRPNMNRQGRGNGSSYGLFTIFTIVSLVILIVIDQQVQTRGFDIVFVILSCLLYLISLIGIASLLIREWVGQLLHLQLFARTRRSWIPWRIVRAIDLYLALVLSMSGVFLAIWSYEGKEQFSHSYSFPDRMNYRNHWAVWLAFMNDAACFDNGGFGQVLLVGEVVLAFSTWHMIISKPLGWIVFGIVITEAYEIVKYRELRDIDRKASLPTIDEQDQEEKDLVL